MTSLKKWKEKIRSGDVTNRDPNLPPPPPSRPDGWWDRFMDWLIDRLF